MKSTVSHAQFRERVSLVLARSGLSYAAFARKARLDRSTLSQLLTGPMPRLPRTETLAAIASTARVSVDWLLGLSQREEVGAEIIEAVMQIEPFGDTPAHGVFLEWLRAAQGTRICSVPIGIPDLLKTEAVLKKEFGDAFTSGTLTPVDAVTRRLEMLGQPHQQLELAISRDSLLAFALGIGQWAKIPPEIRREQLVHMIALVRQLYPTLRVYLYDEDMAYSVPFTVFGAQRVALFLGTNYLALNSPAHIEMFLHRFDGLIRVASTQPHEIADELARIMALV